MIKDNRTNRKWRTKKEARARKIKIFLGVVLCFAVIFAVIIWANQIKSVEVEGNEYYSEQEIKDLIINTPLEKNAWYLYWKYKYGTVEQIPFIDTIEINVTGNGSVKITVYEKGITGMVAYLDNYIYFDKDGILVESIKANSIDTGEAPEKIKSIPEITGLKFDNLTLHEKLPVKDENVFDVILTLTQMLKKNELSPDKIHFNKNSEITLSFGEAKVSLGTDENLAEKIIRLNALADKLYGRKGILHMENFNEDTKNITFEETN